MGNNTKEDNSEEDQPIIVRYQGHRRVEKETYCPVVTYDGITPNPNYKQKPIRY